MWDQWWQLKGGTSLHLQLWTLKSVVAWFGHSQTGSIQNNAAVIA